MRLIDADALREQTVKDAKYAEKNGFMDLKFEREWLVKRIDEQPTICDWISDDLPDTEGEYLIAWKGKLGMTEDWGRTFMEIADYHPAIDSFDEAWDVAHIYDRGWTDVKVLAWMPLPKFYEE